MMNFNRMKSTDHLKIIQNQGWLIGEFLIDIDRWNLIHHFWFAFQPTKLRSHRNAKHRFVRTRRLQMFKVATVAADVTLNYFGCCFWVVHRRCCNPSHRGLFAGYLCLHFAGSNRFNINTLYTFVRSSLQVTRTRLIIEGVVWWSTWWLCLRFVFGRVDGLSRTTHAQFLSFHY